MGILSGLLGNASEVDIEKLENEFENILASGEAIQKAYKVIRDLFVFTDKRLVLVDRQGLTGKKVAYHSIPYKSISQFAVETAGTFDSDAELKIWISSNSTPAIIKEFKKGTDIVGIQQALAEFMLK
ncbi:PH domain-containing protein [Desulfosediminicola flagellatus]|uniref:PH domain-containing protein n=1 Tax=Desulfosediminicola flagellatus TaxID=2569541 RepID=UPI0010ACBF56|nr:PH domain-containing protein [Desulfosediminicola flagellatus]